MSFPKAKLHRFNDEISCTPSPGKYDPKFDKKVKGAVIEKSKRFLSPTNHSSTESLDNLTSACSIKAAQPSVFRTPQLIRKAFTPNLRQRSHSQSEKKLQNVKDQPNENLREENRRLKSLVKALEAELTEQTGKLKGEYNAKEIEFKKIIEEKNILFKSQREDLQNVKKNLNEFNERFKIERDTYLERINELESQKTETLLLQEDLQKLQQQMHTMALNHETELKSITDAAELNYENLNNTFSRRIVDLLGDIDTIKMELQVDTEVKLSKTFNDFVEVSKKMENNYFSCSNNYKELETVFNNRIDKFIADINEANERCNFLCKELHKVESERDEFKVSDLEKKVTIVEIQDKCDEFEYNWKTAMKKCKAYKISVSTMQETIKAVSDRLYASESEIERLNKVEIDLKSQKYMLEEKVTLLTKEGLDLKKSMENMENEIVQDVIRVKNELVERLESITNKAQEEISYLKEAINIRDQDIVNKAQCILDFSIKIDSLEDSRRQADCYTEMLKIEKQDLELQLFDMTEKHFKLESQGKVKDDLIEDLENKINQYKVDLSCINKMARKIEESEKKLQHLECQLHEKDKAVKELEEKYKQKISEPEMEIKSLQDRIVRMKEENVQLDQQVANLLGHQNLKQKIKHVEQLKLQNRLLKEENENLTAELIHEKKKNKENSLSGSPNLVKKGTKHVKPANSPNNTGLSVLKDRNL